MFIIIGDVQYINITPIVLSLNNPAPLQSNCLSSDNNIFPAILSQEKNTSTLVSETSISGLFPFVTLPLKGRFVVFS